MKIEKINIEDKEYDIVIGENQIENDTIIKQSKQNDIWFHLDNISGPHIILRLSEIHQSIVPKRYLNQIGTLFRNYKNGLSNRYTVIYTDIKNVKLTKVPGKVMVSKDVQLIKIITKYYHLQF